jgi:RNA polymerase-binding transcription factor DksA
MKKPRTSTNSDSRNGKTWSGPKAKRATIPDKLRPVYRKLEELRDTLLSQNRNLLREAREPIGTAGSHVAESGTDEFDRGLHFSLLATEQNALHEVEAALSRIEDGTYGVCEISGKRIPAARLKAVPWTRYTAPVEAELERGRRVGKAQANGASPAGKKVSAPVESRALAVRKPRSAG